MDRSKIKPSFDKNRQVLGEIYPLRTPFNIIIDSSEACNFLCSYCFRSSNDKLNWGYAAGNNLMDWDLFQRIFDDVMEFPDEVKQISLSNHGEPLCNRNVPKMARYMRNNGYSGRISIHTNGSLLDEEYATELAESGFSRIVFSIQGISSTKYREVCGVSLDFQKLVDSIAVLYREKKKSETDTQIDIKIADIALEEGEEEQFYSIFCPIADRVFVENIVPIWKNVESVKAEESFLNKYGEHFPKQDCCPLVFHTIDITPSGDVYPCTQLLNDYCLGNIKDVSLVDCWNGNKRKGLLGDILRINTPKMCEGCYISQNSIYTKEDMIDEYRDIILDRLLSGENT